MDWTVTLAEIFPHCGAVIADYAISTVGRDIDADDQDRPPARNPLLSSRSTSSN
jgi:hypothetical protein